MPNIIEIHTVQTNIIKILVEALKEIITDTNIEFNNSGIRISTIDSSQTLLVYLKLEASQFERYFVKNCTVIGVSMLNLYKITKTITQNDTLTFFVDKNDINKLGIRIHNTEKNYTTTYRLKLMDLNEESVEIPSAEFGSIITMPSNQFQKICRDMSVFTDIMEIKSIGENLILSCNGDFAEQETVLGETKEGVSFVKNNEPDNIIQGYYNLKSLVLFTKCTNLCNNIEIYLRNNFPIIIKYEVGDLGELKLCLAPKCDSSDY